MKLLRIIASMEPAGGGPVEGILRQAEAVADQCVTEVACLDDPHAAFLRTMPLRVHALGSTRARQSGSLANRVGYTPGFIPWLSANIGRYDAIIVDGLWNYATWGAARALPGRSTPYFVFTHGMLDPWFRRTYPLKHAVKQASWLANEGPLLAGAQAVLFTCEEEQRQASGQFFHQRYRSAVVGFGAVAAPRSTSAQADAFTRAAAALRRPYLLYLSRLHPKKGCEILIDAYASLAHEPMLPDLVFAGGGDPSYVSALKRRVDVLGITPRVHWTGMLQGDAKWGALHGAEAFVLASHQENFGVAVAEALACAKPVLISNKVNIWREIHDAGAGLVESDDVAGARALLLRFMALGTDARRVMGAAGRSCFHTHFNVAVTAPRMIATMRRLSKLSAAT